MINLAQQTIDFYLKNFKTPTIDNLIIEDTSLLENNGSIFVTIYKKWEIRWASWNIKEIKKNIAEEIITNTIIAITKDPRFKAVKLNESNDLKIRIDKIISRSVLQDNEILQIDPTKEWILAIKKDYSQMAVILPNINPSLLTWEDLLPILKTKFQVKDFNEKEYILYKIQTNSSNNFISK